MPAEPPAGAEPDKDDGPVRALDADDIALLKTYGLGPYTASIKVWRGGQREGEGGESIRSPTGAAGPPRRCPGVPRAAARHVPGRP